MESERPCPNCGQSISMTKRVCHHCGAAVAPAAEEQVALQNATPPPPLPGTPRIQQPVVLLTGSEKTDVVVGVLLGLLAPALGIGLAVGLYLLVRSVPDPTNILIKLPFALGLYTPVGCGAFLQTKYPTALKGYVPGVASFVVLLIAGGITWLFVARS